MLFNLIGITCFKRILTRTMRSWCTVIPQQFIPNTKIPPPPPPPPLGAGGRGGEEDKLLTLTSKTLFFSKCDFPICSATRSNKDTEAKAATLMYVSVVGVVWTWVYRITQPVCSVYICKRDTLSFGGSWCSSKWLPHFLLDRWWCPHVYCQPCISQSSLSHWRKQHCAMCTRTCLFLKHCSGRHLPGCTVRISW
jgi:hypothetical protein